MIRKQDVLFDRSTGENSWCFHRGKENADLYISKVFLGRHGSVDRCRVRRTSWDMGIPMRRTLNQVAMIPVRLGSCDDLVHVVSPRSARRGVRGVVELAENIVNKSHDTDV